MSEHLPGAAALGTQKFHDGGGDSRPLPSAPMPQLIHENLEQAIEVLAARMQNIRDSL